jgi:copper chaperone CopZ
MERRRFVQMMTLASVGTVAAAELTPRRETKTVAYHVKGFTCVTCAVGLETMLARQPGICSVKASYPDGNTVIQFDPKRVTEASLKKFIADLGFSAE